MLTPGFELSQDRTYLTIIIKAPFAKINDTEIFVEENDFKFFSKPYFLRLTLPGNIIEDGREKANYDSDKGSFTIIFAKETEGEHFEGLDMITKLLAPKGSTTAQQPLIQVIDENQSQSDDISKADETSPDLEADSVDDEEVEYDWQIPQTPYAEQPLLLGAPTYGFANKRSAVFKRLQEELCGVIDCPDPDVLTPTQRRRARQEAEDSKFDDDHYIGDLYEDNTIQLLMQYKPERDSELTDDETEVMRKLPNKQYILDDCEEKGVYLGLVDLLFAYAYNHRTTEGENNVESGWTIYKISATMSWLEVYSDLSDVLVTCVRRCLCYPLYRHWQLANTVIHDVIHILRQGRRHVLQCLLEIRGLLMDQESHYILNDLYITDYCVWIQAASTKKIQGLAESLEKISITKKDIGLDLLEVDRIAMVAMEESSDNDVEKVTAQMANVSVNKASRDSDDDESDTTETDDSSTESDDVSSDNDDVTNTECCNSRTKTKEVVFTSKSDSQLSNNGNEGENSVQLISKERERSESSAVGIETVNTRKSSTSDSLLKTRTLIEEL